MRLLHGGAHRNVMAPSPVLLLTTVHATLAPLSESERLWRDIPKPQLSRHLVGCFVLHRLRRGEKRFTQLATSDPHIRRHHRPQPRQSGPDDTMAFAVTMHQASPLCLEGCLHVNGAQSHTRLQRNCHLVLRDL